MESIWWVFKELFNKGLVYRGFKVMPFSTACSTPLSNFESGQNYKEVVDPAGIIIIEHTSAASENVVNGIQCIFQLLSASHLTTNLAYLY